MIKYIDLGLLVGAPGESTYTAISLAKNALSGGWGSDFSWGHDLRRLSYLAIRADLIALVRNGKAETRLTRRANALLLLDDEMSCEAIAKVLYLDDDTIRYWYKLYGGERPELAGRFRLQGRACELTAAQQDALKDWVAQTLPRTTTMVGDWVEKSYGVSYTRSAIPAPIARAAAAEPR